MTEDAMNTAIRRFLKEVGVTSHRAMETAIRDALAAGRIAESDTLGARMTLTIEALGLEHVVEGDIVLR